MIRLQIERHWRWAAALLLLAAFGQSVWALTVGFSYPLMDQHSFRQNQTALTAYFLSKGGPFFAYETPLLGYPWSIPFELPVYQWITAILTLLTGAPVEETGRFVGRFFFYAALLPLFSLFGHFRFAPVSRWLGLVLYLLSPLYLYWSRTILIESTALFFALAHTALFARALRMGRLQDWALVAVAGALAGTIKSTTAFAFFLANGLLLIDARGWSVLSPKRWFSSEVWPSLIFGFGLPGLATLAWLKFSDAQKALNPLATFIRSDQLFDWNFGSWQQRSAGSTWYMFFRKTIHDSIGHRTTWLISLSLLAFLPRRQRWLYLVTSLLFLVPPMVFTNLHIAHNYYWYANGIFLLLAMVACLDGLWERGANSSKFSILFVSFFLLTACLEVRHFHDIGLPWQRELNAGPHNVGLAVRQLTKENEVVYNPGYGWHPAFAFPSQRRSIMDGDGRGFDSPSMREAIERTESAGFHVSLLLMCGDLYNRPDLLARANVFLDLEPKNLGAGLICEMYRIRGIRQLLKKQ